MVRRPRVRLAVTGNELLPSGSHPQGFHIADANGPMLAALIERDGGLVDFPGLVRDDPDDILEALQADADIVRKAWRMQNVEAQLNRTRHLVDVLPAGA